MVLHSAKFTWNFEPWFFVPFIVVAILYVVGLVNIWRHAGMGRGLRVLSSLCFLGAFLTAGFIFISPLDTLSEELFSAHMVQHMLLILVAAPLLLKSEIPLALLWSFPRRWAQSIGHGIHASNFLMRLWQILTHPLCTWLLFTVTFWFWHASSLYEAALRNEFMHFVEHLTFLITAMLFWWQLLKPTEQKHLRYGFAIPYLFTTLLQSGILGALMTFASRPWYVTYTLHANAWNLTPLQDQQLAGLIMWILGGTVFTFLTIGYFAAWLRAMDQRMSHTPIRIQPEPK